MGVFLDDDYDCEHGDEREHEHSMIGCLSAHFEPGSLPADRVVRHFEWPSPSQAERETDAPSFPFALSLSKGRPK